MPTLNNLYTTALLFKGQQACNEFGPLLRLWEGLLKIEDFSQFVFVLTAEDVRTPTGVSEAVSAALSDSTFILSELEPVLPENIIQAVRKRIRSGRVLVQSIISDYGDPEDTLRSLSNLAQRFGMGTNVILYLLLRADDPAASTEQRAFLQALNQIAETEQTKFYTYLLSRRGAQNAEISESARWRALSHEVLINSAMLRTLVAGKLYSLGYSVINADDSELNHLLVYRMEELVEELGKSEFTPPEAWKLLTLDAPVPEASGSHVAQQLVTQWIQHIAREFVRPPSLPEKMNNRALGRVVEMEPESIRQTIKRFYDVNWSEKDWSGFQAEYLDRLKDSLRHRINASAFPREMAAQVIQRLKALAEAKPEPVPIPPRKLLESSKVYAGRVAEAMEKGYQEQMQVRLSAGCAEALMSCLEQFDALVEQISRINADFRLHILDTLQFSNLRNKFRPYWEAILQVGYVKENSLLHPDKVAQLGPFYTDSGKAIPEAWRALVEQSAQQLRDALPGGMKGNFVSALGEMFTDGRELGSFFNEYLLGSQRMLYNVHDAAAPNQTMLFVDKAFENHPWISSQSHRSLITDNDNIEQIELYELAHSAAWYLQDQENPYFSSEMHFIPNVKQAESMWAKTMPDHSDSSEGMQADQKGNEERESPEQGLSLHKMGSNYLLTWNWKPGTLSAKVVIESADHQVASYLCSHAKFADNQGLLINSFQLPYGEIRVSVYCDNLLYAQKTLTGQKNVVKYRFGAGKHGYAELLIQGSISDIRQLVLQAPRGDQKSLICYPISPKPDVDVQRFGGLTLSMPSRTRLAPYPHDKYPKVEAIYHDNI